MRAITRVFSTLDCFTVTEPTLSLQEISTRIGLAKSTTFRLVHTLEQHGYLIRLADQRYMLSLKVCRLASIAKSSNDVQELARPALATLARATGERASLHAVMGDGRGCVDVAFGAGGVAPAIRPDWRMSFGMDAASLVLLAHMPRVTSTRLLPLVARSTDCPLDEFVSILDNVRKDGWAASHGDGVQGASEVAAPILGSDGAAHFCVAVTLPTARVRGRVGALSRLARQAAADISTRFGATPCAHFASTSQRSEIAAL